MEAKRYAVLGIRRFGRMWWEEVAVTFNAPRHGDGSIKAEAIELARTMLDGGDLKAACVQGRGTEELPTPSGEVQVYRGVASGFSPSIFGVARIYDTQDVERR